MNIKTYVLVAVALGSMAVGVVVGCATAAQPHMEAALSSLQNARTELQIAEHDKGGHRIKALALVNDAIAETKLGIAAGM